MGYYHTAQLCINGHMITDKFDSHSELSKPFCPKCGARTITNCPSCNAPIHGDYDCGIPVIGAPYHIDSYCYACGNPYPWTESAIKNATLIIEESEELSDTLKSSMIETLPDVITETPSTNLAVVRMKKCLASAGKFTADALRQFVIDFGCELAKKSCGL